MALTTSMTLTVLPASMPPIPSHLPEIKRMSTTVKYFTSLYKLNSATKNHKS